MNELPIIRVAAAGPTPADIQALAEFMRSSRSADERALQSLLERHPSLIGVLGFSHFLSEFPIAKRDCLGQVPIDHRMRDRADLVAARTSSLIGPNRSPYRSTHVVELKRANHRLAARDHGLRLSEAASHAIQQAEEYAYWLTTVPENRAALSRIGWDVRAPMLYVVMGREEEFRDNPGQLEEIRATFQRRSVTLWTVDQLLREAERARGLTSSVQALLTPKANADSLVTQVIVDRPLTTASSKRKGRRRYFSLFLHYDHPLLLDERMHAYVAPSDANTGLGIALQLACVVCRKPVVYIPQIQKLECKHCRLHYPIQDGVPVMIVDKAERY
jgi:uncharacterized protein YbaR (Trm112 family)